jgi:hypothetical protein
VVKGDPASNAGCSVTASRVFHAGQIQDYDPNEKVYLGPPGWELGVGPTTSPREKLM